jgi:hypothetical protein
MALAKAESPQNIKLGRLYTRGNTRRLLCNAGNFLQTTDGAVVIFSPVIRDDLRSVMANQKTEITATVELFCPAEKKSTLQGLPVTKSGNTLKFGDHLVLETEIDRLMLSPEWPKVLSFCKTRYKCSDPRNSRYGTAVSGSGITRLADHQFLITGGHASAVYDDDASVEISRMAIVFDSEQGVITKRFALGSPRSSHLSLLLPGGNVILIGGLDDNSRSIEVVDPVAGSSRTLSGELGADLIAPTACVNNKGDCFVIGGWDTDKLKTSRMIERIDVGTGAVHRVADLTVPRDFVSTGDPMSSVGLNAVWLKDDSMLVSGGTTTKRGAFFSDLRQDAEIVRPN